MAIQLGIQFPTMVLRKLLRKLRPMWVILMSIPVRLIMIIFAVITNVLLIRAPNRQLPPGPLANWLPIIGSLPLFAFNPSYLVLTRMAKKYGKIFRLKFGSTTCIVMCDSKLIQKVFDMDAISGRKMHTLMNVMNKHGIFNAEGQQMRKQRGIVDRVMLNLTFRNELLRKNFVNSATTAVEDFLYELESRIGLPTDIDEALSFAIINITFSTLFRIAFHREDDELLSLIRATHQSFQKLELLSFADFIPSLAGLPKYEEARKAVQARKVAFRNYMQIVVERSRKELDQENPRNLIDAFLVQMTTTDFQETQFLTDAQLLDILDDIFSISLETIYTTIHWLMLAILKHQHIQDYIHDELSGIVNRFELPMFNMRDDMPYLEATILEGLRFSSILPIGVSHSALHDTVIEGYHIPRNAMVIGLFWKIHRDPELWKNDPSTFNPTNHLDDRGYLRKSQNDMAFSTGIRRCLGDHLAMDIIFFIFGNIMHRFKIYAEDGVELPSLHDSSDGILRKPLPFKIVYFHR